MDKLNFTSSLIGTRYTKDFFLPDFIRDENGKIDKQKCLQVLSDYQYGHIDELGLSVRISDATFDDINVYSGYSVGGKAMHKRLLFSFYKAEYSGEFVVDYYLPTNAVATDTDVVVMLNFVKEVPNKYCPIEELVDDGIGIAHVCFNEITTDNADFTNNVSKIFYDNSKTDNPGKIAIWAYVANWIGIYLTEHGLANKQRLYVAGHSRLGKTALVACAYYDVFAGCMVNCSGCSGVAIHRQKHGETIKEITDVFPYWFTDKFKQFANKEEQLPFDQHYLLGAVCPKKAFIVTASEDDWADTDAQYLCAQAASVAYRENGLTGMEQMDITTGQVNDKGEIKFFKRQGQHYFTRQDWAFYVNCLKSK